MPKNLGGPRLGSSAAFHETEAALAEYPKAGFGFKAWR